MRKCVTFRLRINRFRINILLTINSHVELQSLALKEYIVQSTGKLNFGKAWISALAATKLLKTLWTTENCGNHYFLLLPQCFLSIKKLFLLHSLGCPSANPFDLDTVEIFLFGKNW